jgi:hypothetical protein
VLLTTATKLLGVNTGIALARCVAPEAELQATAIKATAIAAPADALSNFLNIGILLDGVGDQGCQRL